MVEGFPVKYEDVIIQAVGLWCVLAPNDRFRNTRLLVDGTQVLHERFITVAGARKAVDEMNDWAKKQGGRPKTVVKAEEYKPELKVDKRTKAYKDGTIQV